MVTRDFEENSHGLARIRVAIGMRHWAGFLARTPRRLRMRPSGPGEDSGGQAVWPSFAFHDDACSACQAS